VTIAIRPSSGAGRQRYIADLGQLKSIISDFPKSNGAMHLQNGLRSEACDFRHGRYRARN
jgi:hypothetical protein